MGDLTPTCTFFSTDKAVNAGILDSRNSEEDLLWELDDPGALTITGSGEMNSVLWKSHKKQIKRVDISEGVTSVANYAFDSYYELTDVSLPESIKKIGIKGFAACYLTEIHLPNGITEIGDSAFSNNELQSVRFPNSFKVISRSMF